MPSINTSTQSTASPQPTAEDLANVHQLGYDLGQLQASHWDAVRYSARFKHMTLTDYRNSGLRECVGALIDPTLSGAFTDGFLLGFKDNVGDPFGSVPLSPH